MSMHDELKRVLIEKATAATERFSRENDFSACSERALKIAAVVNTSYPALLPAFELILGETLPRRSGEIIVVKEKLVVLVPLSNPNSHDYRLHEPAITVTEGTTTLLRVGLGSIGNIFPVIAGAYRVGNAEEIDKAVTAYMSFIGI